MEAFNAVKEAFGSQALEVKHEEFTMSLNDAEYNKAEEWMQTCNSECMTFTMLSKDYINASVAKNNDDALSKTSDDEGNENEEVNVEDENFEENDGSENDDEPEEDTVSVVNSAKSFKPCSINHEKPKLPKFNGDVHQYFIFKSDIQHAIEAHCSERDTLTVLRSCLDGQPAKLIEGIGSDLKTAWKTLIKTMVIQEY